MQFPSMVILMCNEEAAKSYFANYERMIDNVVEHYIGSIMFC